MRVVLNSKKANKLVSKMSNYSFKMMAVQIYPLGMIYVKDMQQKV